MLGTVQRSGVGQPRLRVAPHSQVHHSGNRYGNRPAVKLSDSLPLNSTSDERSEFLVINILQQTKAFDIPALLMVVVAKKERERSEPPFSRAGRGSRGNSGAAALSGEGAQRTSPTARQMPIALSGGSPAAAHGYEGFATSSLLLARTRCPKRGDFRANHPCFAMASKCAF